MPLPFRKMESFQIRPNQPLRNEVKEVKINWREILPRKHLCACALFWHKIGGGINVQSSIQDGIQRLVNPKPYA